MSKKRLLLLLDAGAIIGAHELGIWSSMRAGCDLVAGDTVLNGESLYWLDAQGIQHPITAVQGIPVKSATIDQVKALLARFPRLKLDAGERELLAWFLSLPAGQEKPQIVTSDKALLLALGQSDLGEHTISLEEIAARVGQSKPATTWRANWKYTRAFREKYVAEGFGKRF